MQLGGEGSQETAAQWENGGSYGHLEYGARLLHPT